MANRYAVATGNWSSTATWDGGTLPQAGDDVRANGFTVTINQDVTVASLRTDASSPAVAGGGFTVTGNGRIINANLQVGTTRVLSCSTNINWFFNGNIFTYSAVNINAIFLDAAGQSLTMVGNVNGNGGASSNGASINANLSANITITGNVTGGSNGACYGVGYTSTAGGFLTITGNVTGGSASTGYGVFCNNGGNIVTINGIITGGFTPVGVYMNLGTLQGNCISAGCPLTTGAVGVFGTAASNCTISDAIYTDCPPTAGKVRFKNINPKVTVLKANGTSQVLVEAGASGDFPITENVRSGISYASGSLTGTLAVPLPANVRKGVPTDNTVGTADLTAADFWNTLTSTLTTAGSVGKLVTDNLNATVSSRATQTSVDTANTNINNIPANVWDKATNTLTTSGSIGERLKNASTVQTTGDQLASYQV